MVSYKQRVARARITGEYEPLRARLTELINAQHTRDEIQQILGVSAFIVDTAIPALDLQSRRGRRAWATQVKKQREDAEVIKDLATQRAEEHHWVRIFREAYGPVGRGFSIA